MQRLLLQERFPLLLQIGRDYSVYNQLYTLFALMACFLLEDVVIVVTSVTTL